MKKLKNNELQRISVNEFKKAKKTPVIVILDNVRSALNVGSIFRTADAFLIEKIILCGITAVPPNKEIHKVALGSNLSVNWEYCKNTLDSVREWHKKGGYIIGVEQTNKSTMLNDFRLLKQPVVLIFGNEVSGISQEVLEECNEVIEIPQFGTKHSLNISVTAGIVLWKLWEKLS